MECSEGTRECPVSVVASILSDGNHVRLEDGQQRHLIWLAVHSPQVLVFSCVTRSRPSARHNHFRQILRNDVHVMPTSSGVVGIRTSSEDGVDERIAPPSTEEMHELKVTVSRERLAPLTILAEMADPDAAHEINVKSQLSTLNDAPSDTDIKDESRVNFPDETRI
ncbi:hypothetical protein BLNAU_20670 [Blattamonas nauphoetae]|uniref:Uncharacterized protein n=1 Tax=Blattamonas nauphoetae TaxID=2049346 RepID=A0ABQ9WY71_9EUKA|nr:hypothetical protein BLNAU_20670 [Blattamonas nauphoetae]